jgi:hypothetical protein
MGQAYSFTSVPIAKALLNAHKRGVKILVRVDKSNRTFPPFGRAPPVVRI